MTAPRRRIVSRSSRPRIFTVSDWKAEGLGQMKPGDGLDEELYDELRWYGYPYPADPRVLAANGCIRGYCLGKVNDRGNDTYGETPDGRYVYLGLSIPLDETPYIVALSNPNSLDSRYDARVAAKAVDAEERRQREWARDPRSKYVDADGCRIDGTIGTFDDLVEYYILLHPEYADRLRDPEVVGYPRDYYAHMDYVNHGNVPGYEEDADGETMLIHLYDLTEEAESFQTEFMEDEYENGDTDMLDFLRRRAAIQRRYGVEPDWKDSSSGSRKASRPKAKTPAKRPAPKAKPKSKGARRWARPTTPTTPASSCGPSSTSPTRTGTARSSPTSPTTRSA